MSFWTDITSAVGWTVDKLTFPGREIFNPILNEGTEPLRGVLGSIGKELGTSFGSEFGKNFPTEFKINLDDFRVRFPDAFKIEFPDLYRSAVEFREALASFDIGGGLFRETGSLLREAIGTREEIRAMQRVLDDISLLIERNGVESAEDSYFVELSAFSTELASLDSPKPGTQLTEKAWSTINVQLGGHTLLSDYNLFMQPRRDRSDINHASTGMITPDPTSNPITIKLPLRKLNFGPGNPNTLRVTLDSRKSMGLHVKIVAIRKDLTGSGSQSHSLAETIMLGRLASEREFMFWIAGPVPTSKVFETSSLQKLSRSLSPVDDKKASSGSFFDELDGTGDLIGNLWARTAKIHKERQELAAEIHKDLSQLKDDTVEGSIDWRSPVYIVIKDSGKKTIKNQRYQVSVELGEHLELGGQVSIVEAIMSAQEVIVSKLPIGYFSSQDDNSRRNIMWRVERDVPPQDDKSDWYEEARVDVIILRKYAEFEEVIYAKTLSFKSASDVVEGNYEFLLRKP